MSNGSGTGAKFAIKVNANATSIKAIDGGGTNAAAQGTDADTNRVAGTYYIDETTANLGITASDGTTAKTLSATLGGFRIAVVIASDGTVTSSTLLSGGVGFADNDINHNTCNNLWSQC